MTEGQILPPSKCLALARERFDAARDFTVAVEEEFALLDPDTLDLTNRFEELQSLAVGRKVESHLTGELIASEAEVRTGCCESFSEVAERMGCRRGQLRSLAAELGVLLGAAGTHPWSSWKEQRILDTPHDQRNNDYLRYAAWRDDTFGLHVHVGIRGADRAVRVASCMRNFLPELLALSASSPFVEGVNSGLHSTRTQIFTRALPRCGVPGAFANWEEYERFVRILYDTGSISEPAQLWWSVRTHLAFPTVEVRIADAQPDIGEARSLAALTYALVARCARALDEGEPFVWRQSRMIEENLWRAIRWGLQGEMIDLATLKVRPTRVALEELIEWVLPVAEEMGVTSYLTIPQQNSAERQFARFEEGASLREIYAELVAPS